ncbi:HAD family hydrolase [Falsirhodobacter halotolerans]|uniref:HAD family hydrolase n=1 Tax=Falsirhodobacter halotolerans TaxID=1146892 RepID=UPI001FD177F8|nr:HAD-IA family hydrolase [Falsirhodobacter halotolerans]MCJ8140658.1 HAD-IA family hydrolase [Falsirhodobacter halotolerans]
MIAAVIFDCDGVLVDSEGPTLAMLKQDLALHGLPVDDAMMERLFLGTTMPLIFRSARQLGADLPDGWVGDFYERLYALLRGHTPLISGIPALLDRLDAAGLPYAVGSNGTTEKMGITLGQHPDVYRRLKRRLFSGQELNMPKPDPGLYRHIAQFLGVDPAHCAVIEDSVPGARAARLAGMTCFGYAPHGPHPALEAEGARLFTHMGELPALLGLQ